jgi:type III pantothenate kinase
MMLLVDAGNSRVKWALYEQDQFATRGAIEHEGDGFAAHFAEHWRALAPPTRVVVANVAGKRCAQALREWCRATWSVDAEFLAARRRAQGVVNAYHESQRLGVDRWTALVAARAQHKGHLCVVDCGSALTLDAINSKGQHLGGLIVPGLALARRALLEQAEGVGSGLKDQTPREATLLARDTAGAVEGGVLYGAVALVDRVLADLRAELGEVQGFICGGDAPRLLPLLGSAFRHAPDLVLQGIALCARPA